MREDEFRDRLKGAIGEPPPLASPSYGPGTTARRRLYPAAMGVLAVALAVLLVLVLVGTRLALTPRGNVGPLGKASPSSSPAGPDSFPCALPVTLISEATVSGQDPVFVARYGFVNVPGGTFRVDPAASFEAPTPVSYSPRFKRWLPVSLRMVSPDGAAYAYVKLLPAGASYSTFSSSELHVVDIASNRDRKLWSRTEGIEVIAWQAAGILASTVPKEGGIRLLWLVDPASGAPARAPESADPERLPLTATRSGVNYSYMGGDAQGAAVFRIGSRDRGVKYSVILMQGGQSTTIYSGTAGDAKDFDPEGLSFDAHGAWFGNFDGKLVWLWSRSSGLQGFPVSGLPTVPSAYNYSDFTVLPAGPCVPGTFSGVAASPVPAPRTPSPSPVPSPVAWSNLLSAPLHLPVVGAGGACPVSSMVNNLAVSTRSGKGGPNYGYGDGPSYLSGQINWYSAGSQGVLILTDPRYRGPILVRTKRLDGSGSLGLGGASVALGADALGIDVTSNPPYWGEWNGTMVPTAAGCYGIQIDGTSFSTVVVIQVKKGPPPPG